MNTIPNHNLNYVSFSNTSIKVSQQCKIDTIIGKLEYKKKQLIEKIKKSGKKNAHSKRENINACNTTTKQEAQQGKAQELRIKKYQNKIETQLKCKDSLLLSLQTVKQKIFNLIIELENYELKLKSISSEVGNKFRQMVGLDHDGCQKSKKWLYHKILNLESQIMTKSLSMRSVLCKFYISENKIIGHKYIPPIQSVINFVVKMRLVNKLYGSLLQNKAYRNSKKQNLCFKSIKTQKSEQSSSLQSQSQEEVSKNQSLLSQISQNSLKTQTQNFQENKTKDHDIWLQILKLMKSLEKLQQVTEPISNIIEIQQLDFNIDLVSFHKQIKQFIQNSKSIKNKVKSTKESIEQFKKQQQEILQELNMKQKLIETFKKKLFNLQKTKQDIKVQQIKKIQNKPVDQNPQKIMEVRKKQLRQIEEAINYFNIKKSTSYKNFNQQNLQTRKLNSVGDLSTNILSPIKSSINFNQLGSPDLTKIKRPESAKKYSMKKLLSPPKFQNTLDKRKVWK